MVTPSGFRETKVFIDRIEDETVVLLVGDDEEVILPRHLLPGDAGEGVWLTLAFSVDEAETEARRTAVQERRSRLSRNDDMGDLDL